MELTIFGATGKVGRLLVHEALQRGYKVLAVAHGEIDLEPHENLHVRPADVHNPRAVAEAIRGKQAILSTLGSWGTKRHDVLSTAIRHLIPAMNEQGIARLISLTGAGAFLPEESPPLSYKITQSALALVAKPILEDGERHLKLLKESDLEWTVIRSPIMNSSGRGPDYELTPHIPGALSTISRESVAFAMLDELQNGFFIRQAPYIKRTTVR